MTMKPLLAASFDLEQLNGQLSTLQYPVICSPKLDGIRVLLHPELGPVTRKLKPVPNHKVRTFLSSSRLAGLDGEVTVGPPYSTPEHGDVFNRTTTIMARDSEPTFTYWVFDHFSTPDVPYAERLRRVAQWVSDLGLLDLMLADIVKTLEYKLLYTPEDVLAYEGKCIEAGYEGIIIRRADGRYKFNRATLREQIMIKLKRVADDEATIEAVEPRYRNDNEQQIDNLGYAKRSSHQANKVPLDMVGKLICRSPKFADSFGIGSGFDHGTAANWWLNRDHLIGKTVTFKYQACGTIDRPRHPIFKGFRED